MNTTTSLVLRSQSHKGFDAIATLGMVREVFDDIAVAAADRTASEDGLITTLASASASEIEDRLDALNEYLEESSEIASSDAVQLALDGLRFAESQLRTISLVADRELAVQAICGARGIPQEVMLVITNVWSRI